MLSRQWKVSSDFAFTCARERLNERLITPRNGRSDDVVWFLLLNDQGRYCRGIIDIFDDKFDLTADPYFG